MRSILRISPEQLRIAFFSEIFVPKIDGIVRVTCILLDQLQRVGAQAIMFAPGKHPESYAGFPVVSIPGLPFPIYPEVKMGLPGRRSYQKLAGFNPTLVHAINPFFAGVQGMRFAHRLNKPVVASFQTHAMAMADFYGLGFLKGPLWRFHRFLYNRADYRVAPSKTVIDELHEHGFRPVHHWKRGVDIEAFSPQFANPEIRRKLSNDQPDKVLLLSVGRLAPEKQVERLVPVLDAVPNTHLVIVGDGPHRAALERAFAGRSVTFTGYKRGRELSEVYASCDIFTFPSAKIETFGLVALEAMAAGLATVSSRVGGVPELVDQGRNGFMFDPGDTQKMIEYVRVLAEDTTKRRAMGQSARETARKLSWQSVMDDLIQQYCEVAATYPNPRVAAQRNTPIPEKSC
ncbi:MAG: glycosyltransferase family 4 protein [Aggregatilineales bacterium]